MSKLKLFLILASALLISCNPTTGPEDQGTGGGGNGGGGTGTGGGTPLTENPSWFLTAEQQSKPLNQEQILFDTTTSQKYRIPAIICADNGNLIVFSDDRHGHGSDIGQSVNAVDVVYRLSKDGGKTWSDPKTILPFSTAGNQGINNKGDVLVFKSIKNPGTLVAMAASGGAWFGNGNPQARFAMSKSTDNGETWSQWKEVGQNIWDELASKYGSSRKVGFLASGRGLTLEGRGNGSVKGRLVGAMMAKNSGGATIIHTIYSDDDGETWKMGGYLGSSSDVPEVGNSKGSYNESKIIAELNDGTLVMSTRNDAQNKARMAAYSTDGGMTWYSRKIRGTKDTFGGWVDMIGSNTDSEGVVYTRQGVQDKNRMLHIHTTSTSSRAGMALYLSENEADTWTKVLTLEQDSMTTCYSSIEVLPDGTFCVLYERNLTDRNAYDIVFKKFNLYDIKNEAYSAEYYKDWYVGKYK